MKAKVLNISAIVGASLLVIVSLGFVGSKTMAILCSGVTMDIDFSTGHEFVSTDDLHAIVYDYNDSLVARHISSIDLKSMEDKVKKHPFVDKVNAYFEIDGELHIEVTQKEPLMRVIPSRGEGYYLDNDTLKLPLSRYYTARVLVANGNIKEKMAQDVEPVKGDLVKDLYKIGHYVSQDPFWKSQITQIFVDDKKEIWLIPRVGFHKILLGNAQDIDRKFKNLHIFYKEGLNKIGWSHYETINLKFNNQIVCTKK
jgi:cell division protein FtsQ